jgi:4a-hydroxytetrahydrobiopterin dehydratase
MAAGDIQAALQPLPGWRVEGDALRRELLFRDFSEALAFLVRVGIEAERMDHHPEIVNSHRRVALRLNTHDAGGRVTPLDFELAMRIQALLPPG